MVFEKAFSSFLTGYMQQYVESFDADQLRVGVWSGRINLTGLTLRTEAIQIVTDLPFQIIAGQLDSLKIVIPWNRLGQHPMQVVISGLRLVLRHKSHDWDLGTKDQKLRAVEDELRKAAAAAVGAQSLGS